MKIYIVFIAFFKSLTTMNILSSVDLFGLKPDWTSLNLDSTILDNLLFNIIVNILYAMFSIVIGL